ncbi:MAG: M23 family metallopeptidase [Amoebophilaceae bacterium]|nr:M23 family metallopeptidase [Amoebophilaceae bacterium]
MYQSQEKTTTPLSIYRRFKDNFEANYQLILRNVANFSEHVSYPFSYVTFVVIIFAWFAGNFGLGLYLAKTVLAKWMNPVYIESENQKKIHSLATLVETLEGQIESQTTFIAALQKIIQGKSIKHTTTKPTISSPIPPTNPPKEGQLSPSPKNNKKSPSRGLFPPMNGTVTCPFNSKSEHYGVDIVAGEKEPIKAISAGIIIFADWSVDTGWVIAIQHYNNLVSISKHCSVLFKKVGNLVRSGDVVALMGNSGELSTGPHLHFELWSEGVALNPEDFINF